LNLNKNFKKIFKYLNKKIVLINEDI
jgi:hypothetical protein